jgi:phosphatidylserine decarboxylase
MVPIHRAGWPFIALFAAGTVALNMYSDALGLIGVVLTLWCVYFFRDPERITPVREGLIISPADGVVQMIDKAPPPKELDMGDKDRWRVCVFMNVFNVHVNRIPIGGTVTALNYRPGKFLNASLDKASELNERQSLGLTLANGKDIAFVQIAGLVARRILCDVTEGQEMKTGERFGMIRFGSRVDVYLPDGVKPLVAVGQTAIAGETMIADIQAKEPARAGEIR